jgi:hypothetical protein
MHAVRRLVLSVLLLSCAVGAQVVHIENNNPTTGAPNSFPWNRPNGFTTLHVYTAAQLQAGGVCPGAVLIDAAVAPSSGATGPYQAPQARLSIGHLLNSPPIAGMWEANIIAPTVIHDLTSGPYTFPWTVDVWTPLPGFASGTFAWDGATDIAIFYTSSPGTTGLFWTRITATNLRHAVTVFQATNQTPTSNGLFAMKIRLTFVSGSNVYQVNQPAAGVDVDGIQSTPCAPGVATRALNVTSMINLTSINAPLGYEIVLTTPEGLVPVGGGAFILPQSGQFMNVDLAAPSLLFLNNLAFPPFPGNFTIPFSSPNPVTFAAQMGVIDPTSLDGLALSGGIQLGIQ